MRDVLAVLCRQPGTVVRQADSVAGRVDVTFNEPMGVVGVITPWNFPMVIASWAIPRRRWPPATRCWSKPAELTPLTVRLR